MIHDWMPPFLSDPDRCLFQHSPMLMVPRIGSLPPCPVGGRRYLAASDGIWVEVVTPALSFRQRLCAVELPFGAVSPCLDLNGAKAPYALLDEFKARARSGCPSEVAALLLGDGHGRFRLYWPPVASAGRGHVTWLTDIPDGWHLVIDLHSHGQGTAFFSPTDDASDRSIHEPHLSMVYGRCDSEPTVCARACVGHHLIPLDPMVLSPLFEDGALADVGASQ